MHLLLLLACDKTVHIEADPACEPLLEKDCALPWPSDRYLVEDESTPTGWRVSYPAEALPEDVDGNQYETEEYGLADGMPIGPRLLARFEGTPGLSQVAFHDDIGRSLDPDHPIVVVDLETGELLPHWAELDAEETDGSPTLIINLTRGLEPDRAYGVALRGLATESGPIEASPAFAALRDDTPTDHEDLERRRPGMEELFTALEAQGVAREELFLAWRWHTASPEYLHDELLVMRDRYLEALGTEGLGCAVESVEYDWEADSDYPLARYIRGTVTVPTFLPDPDGLDPRIARDDQGLPEVVGTDEIPFTFLVPYSTLDGSGPAPLMAYGHGLMATGERTISNEMFRDIAENNRMLVVATDWYGMSTPDAATVSLALKNPADFIHTAEKLQQGMLHWTALTRTFTGVCHDLPDLSLDDEPLIDVDRVSFGGGSQGGIFGGTALALHPDVHRGVLFVGGANMPFLMDRSWDFLPYEPVLTGWYPRRVDQLLGLELTSHWWDWVDPIASLPHLHDGFGLTEPKQVVSIVALNDVQVTNLGSDLAARTAGWPVVEGSARAGWGLDEVAAPYEGSAYITVDLGDREGPQDNSPPQDNDHGHSTIGWPASVQEMLLTFIEEGVVDPPCEGPCDPD